MASGIGLRPRGALHGGRRPLDGAYAKLAHRCSPADGVYATALDMLRFQRAVLAGRLLDEGHTRLLLNGFRDDRDEAEQLGIIGGEHGMNAGVGTRLESGVTVVVLANLDPPAGERVMLGLLEWIGDGTRLD